MTFHPEYKLSIRAGGYGGWRVKIWSNGRIYDTLEFYNSYDDAKEAFNEFVRRKKNV